MKLYPLHEQEAVKKLKEGDIAAFNQLFQTYESQLFGYAASLLPDKKDAEGILQEVFYRIWKNREKLDETKSFKSFLFTVSKNLIYNAMAKHTHQVQLQHYQANNFESSLNAVAVSSDDLYDYHELESIIQKVVNTMSFKRKQVFIMSRFQGMNNKEIATQLNISLSTVENHINKSLKHLREQLTTYDIQLALFIIFFFG